MNACIQTAVGWLVLYCSVLFFLVLPLDVVWFVINLDLVVAYGYPPSFCSRFQISVAHSL